MKKIYVLFTLILVALLISCSSSKESLEDCIVEECGIAERSYVFADYIAEVLFLDETPVKLNTYGISHSFLNREGVLYLKSAFYGDSMSKMDLLNQLDSVSFFHTYILDDVRSYETDNDVEVTTSLSLIDDNMLSFVSFKKHSIGTEASLEVTLDGSAYDHSDYMRIFYLEIDDIFEYKDNDYKIEITLITSEGTVNILSEQDTNEVFLTFSSTEDWAFRVDQVYMNLDNALDDKYTLTLVVED